MRMVTSRFGIGKILRGTDPRIGNGGHSLSYCARVMKEACQALPVVSVCHATIKLPSFFEAEELGTLPKAHCDRCTRLLSKCKDCSYRGQVLNREQREVVKRVETSMFLDPVTRKIHVQYPFKPAAYHQRSNHGQAVAVQSNIERRLTGVKLSD